MKQEKYKILLVEDGSINVDELEQFIFEHNLKIKIVVYRQGSALPCFLKQAEVQKIKQGYAKNRLTISPCGCNMQLYGLRPTQKGLQMQVQVINYGKH